MNEGKPPPALVAGAAVVLVACAAQAWILELPFRQDDHVVITSVGSWLGRLTGGGAGTPVDALANLFRPVFWAMIALEAATFSKPYHAFGFYATALVLHACASFLAWRAARVFLTPGAALVAGLVFAVNPAGTQALAWIAAGGDLLSTSFLALGLVLVLTLRSSSDAAVAAGVCGALAAGSKVSGFVGIPVLAILVFLRGGSDRFRNAVIPLVAAVLVAGARAAYAGSWIPTYHSFAAASAEGIASRFLDVRLWLSMFAQILVPWNLSEDAAGVRPLIMTAGEGLGLAPRLAQAIVAGAIAALLIVPAVLHSPRRALACLVSCVLLAMPAISLWIPGQGTARSRDFYAVGVPIALLAGLSFSAGIDAWRRRPSLRPLAMAGVLVFVVVTADCWWHTRAYQRLVGRAIDSRVQSMESLAAVRGPGTTFVVADPETLFAQQYLLGPTLPQAFAPPFRTSRLNVIPVGALSPLIESELLIAMTAAVQLVVTRDHRFEETGAPIPAIPATLPELRAVDAPESGRAFAPTSPVPARAVAAVRLALGPGEAGLASVTVVAGGRRCEGQARVRASASPRVVTIPLRPDPDFLREPRIDRVVVSPSPAPGPSGRSVELLPQTAPVEPRAPADRAILGIDALRFAIPVEGVCDGAELMLARGSWMLRFEFDAASLHAAGGVVTLDPASAATVESPIGPLDWPRIRAYLASLCAESAGRPVETIWRVRLVVNDGNSPDVQTRWRRLFLTP